MNNKTAEKMMAGMYIVDGEMKGVRSIKASCYGTGLVLGFEIGNGLEVQVTASDIYDLIRTSRNAVKKVR